jgi:L-ascorbate metabolism protein UlaG (beta-lactamase superfamily)
MSDGGRETKRRPGLGVAVAAIAALVIAAVVLATRPGGAPPANGPAPAPGATPGEPPAAGNRPLPSSTRTGAPSVRRPGPGTPPATATPQEPDRPAPPDLPPDHPPISSSGGPQVSLQWFGHACFYIHTPGGVAVVTDPFDPRATGFRAPETGAHFVTVSAEDPAHAFTRAVHAFQGDARRVIRGTEVRRGDLRILPVPTGGGNTAYVFEAGEFRIAHLGRLAAPLTAEQARRIGRPDVLLLPAGGEGISPEQAVALAKALRPRVVIPMAYAVEAFTGPDARLKPVDAFIAASPFAVTAKSEDIILFGKAELPPSTEVYTLRPTSGGVER